MKVHSKMEKPISDWVIASEEPEHPLPAIFLRNFYHWLAFRIPDNVSRQNVVDLDIREE